jgi:hypothetical protein
MAISNDRGEQTAYPNPFILPFLLSLRHGAFA